MDEIFEIGYKYQMTDISATLGLDSLSEINDIIKYRRKLYIRYLKLITEIQRDFLHRIFCNGSEGIEYIPWHYLGSKINSVPRISLLH